MRSLQVARESANSSRLFIATTFRPEGDSPALSLQPEAAAKAGPTSPLKRLRFPFPPQGSSLGSDFASHRSPCSLGLDASLAKFPHPDPRVGALLGQCEQRGAGRGARARLRGECECGCGCVCERVPWGITSGPRHRERLAWPRSAPRGSGRRVALSRPRQGAEAARREQKPESGSGAQASTLSPGRSGEPPRARLSQAPAVEGTLDSLLLVQARPK